FGEPQLPKNIKTTFLKRRSIDMTYGRVEKSHAELGSGLASVVSVNSGRGLSFKGAVALLVDRTWLKGTKRIQQNRSFLCTVLDLYYGECLILMLPLCCAVELGLGAQPGLAAVLQVREGNLEISWFQFFSG
ncbi:MAG: hypothetical protein ACRD6N_07005, partial [Pyrinomonadaceae bacterium]